VSGPDDPAGITRLILLPPAAFGSITATVVATGAVRVLPTGIESDVAPLLAARTFGAPEPLPDYGLDHPVAVITYVRGGAPVAVLRVGSPDFDAHGFYVSRPGDSDVYLVLSANLAPVLTLIGIATPAPS